MPLNPLALLFICLAACAQSVGQSHTNNSEYVTLGDWRIPENSSAFTQLWNRMDSIEHQETAGLSVLYIGGSHVQSGWLGHALRNELHRWAPHLERSRGMHLPYRIAQTNTPTHFRTEYEGTWKTHRCVRGTGQAICAEAPLATGLVAQPEGQTRIQHVAYFADSTRAMASSLEIWTDAPPSMWQWDGNAPLKKITPLADTTGWLLTLETPADTLAILFDIPKGTCVWYAGMQSVPSTPASLTVHEWGHNGCRIAHAAAAEGWEALMTRLKPDVVFIGIGLNDAVQGTNLNMEAFASLYTPWVQRFRSSGASVVLLGNTPAAFNGKSLEEPNEQIEAFLMDCSDANAFGYMSLTDAMAAHGGMNRWEDEGWMKPDGIHFNPEGYTQIARLIFQAWMAAYEARKNNASLTPKARVE